MRVFVAGGAGMLGRATGVAHFVAQSYASWNGIRDPLDPTSTGKGAEAIRHLEDVVVRAGGMRHPSWRQGFKEEPA
ncbi:hypothetical protein JYK22_35915, partial [Nonomuraea sp. RK-328]|nr:hypothetical protein [Nonomuraea sp. RK-328]